LGLLLAKIKKIIDATFVNIEMEKSLNLLTENDDILGFIPIQ